MKERRVRSHELTLGRSFGVAFDHGEDFFTALAEFCRANHLRQGYIPVFIAGFAEAEIVGTCGKLDDPQAPVWSSVHLTNIEALRRWHVGLRRSERRRASPHPPDSRTQAAQRPSAHQPPAQRQGAVPHRDAADRGPRTTNAACSRFQPLRRSDLAILANTVQPADTRRLSPCGGQEFHARPDTRPVSTLTARTQL
jgi:hypothetical protein